VAASLAASLLVFAAALVWFHRLLLPAETATKTGSATKLSRRAALTKLGLSVAGLALGGFGWRSLTGTLSRPPASQSTYAGGGSGSPANANQAAIAGAQVPVASFSPAPGAPAEGTFELPGLSSEVTPTKDFYTVSKNFFD